MFIRSSTCPYYHGSLFNVFIELPILLIDCSGRAFIDFSGGLSVANLEWSSAPLKYVLIHRVLRVCDNIMILPCIWLESRDIVHCRYD